MGSLLALLHKIKASFGNAGARSLFNVVSVSSLAETKLFKSGLRQTRATTCSNLLWRVRFERNLVVAVKSQDANHHVEANVLVFNCYGLDNLVADS